MSDYQSSMPVAVTGTDNTVTNRVLRVGIIGLGIGRMHIEGWRQHPGTQVVAIADTDAERLLAVGEQFGIAARYADALAMMATEKLDVVSVCTPNKFHKDLTIAALDLGSHVLCEKPMANTAAVLSNCAVVSPCGKKLFEKYSANAE